jgi:hypothetical protein
MAMDIFLRMHMHMHMRSNVNKQIQNKHAKCMRMRMPALYKHENNHHKVHCLAWQRTCTAFKNEVDQHSGVDLSICHFTLFLVVVGFEIAGATTTQTTQYAPQRRFAAAVHHQAAQNSHTDQAL